MGCGGSRLGVKAMVLPPRLRPHFLLRTRSCPQPLKDSTSDLLLHERDHEEGKFSSSHIATPLSQEDNTVIGRKSEENHQGKAHKNPKSEEGFQKNEGLKIREESEFEDALTDAYDDGDEDEDYNEDGDRRMIGQDDDGAFPGSPSFRYYYKDDGKDERNDLGEIKNSGTISSDDDTVSSKEFRDQNKKEKRRRRKKSFKKVLPKGQTAVKNLLNVKSCYTPSPSSHHRHLLTGKTST